MPKRREEAEQAVLFSLSSYANEWNSLKLLPLPLLWMVSLEGEGWGGKIGNISRKVPEKKREGEG